MLGKTTCLAWDIRRSSLLTHTLPNALFVYYAMITTCKFFISYYDAFFWKFNILYSNIVIQSYIHSNIYLIMFFFRCVKSFIGSTLISSKSKDKLYFWEKKQQGDFSNILEACCSFGITYEDDRCYHILIFSLKGKLCFCSVNRPHYNLSAFELVFMAWNLDSDSYNRVVPWFPVQPILPHRNQPRWCISWIFHIASGFTSLTYFIRTHESTQKDWSLKYLIYFY